MLHYTYCSRLDPIRRCHLQMTCSILITLNIISSIVFHFQNCLGIIYTVWVENLGVPLETLVGNLVGCVLVPAAGGPQVRFSIGAGDRQALQPPAAPPLPVTSSSVYMLLRLLGLYIDILNIPSLYSFGSRNPTDLRVSSEKTLINLILVPLTYSNLVTGFLGLQTSKIWIRYRNRTFFFMK